MNPVIYNDCLIVANFESTEYGVDVYVCTLFYRNMVYDRFILNSKNCVFDSSSKFYFCRDNEIIELDDKSKFTYVYKYKFYNSINDCLVAIIIDENSNEVVDLLFNTYLK